MDHLSDGSFSSVRQGRTVRVSYTDPTPIDGIAVLQGRSGADVHSFANVETRNLSELVASNPGVGPAPESARVVPDGSAVIVSFDEELDGESIPGSGAFTVKVGGTGAAVSGVAAGNGADELRIEVGEAILPDRTVTVGYTRPASGNRIQDADGNQAESFTDFPVVARPARQDAPPGPLTAEFEDLPTVHTGVAFTFGLRFSEEFPVSAETLRSSAFAITNGSVTAASQAQDGKSRNWRITVTPASARDPVTITLAPKATCETRGAICTEDGRNLSEAVEAEVAGRPPVVVTGVAVTSSPGENGTWDTGEKVEAEVRFDAQITVVAPPGRGPVLTVLLDGVAREAAYHAGHGTDTLTFRHTVTADDDGARRARVAANGLDLDGTTLAHNAGRPVEPGFSVAPWVTGVELVADASGDGSWTPGETVEARLTFSEAVTVEGGNPRLEVRNEGFAHPSILDYASGSGSAVLSFSREVPASAEPLTGLAVVADSLVANGATVVSHVSGLAAELGHDGTAPTPPPVSARQSGIGAAFVGLPPGHGGAAFSFEIAFTDAPGAFSYRAFTGADGHARVLTVSNGAVTRARRLEQGDDRNRRWEIDIAPAGAGDVTIALPESPPCGEAGAVCTSDGARLVQAVTAVVPENAPVQAEAPFRVVLEEVPEEHDGSGVETFRVEFTKRPKADYSYVTLRDETLEIRQGATALVPKVRRLNKPHNDLWEVTVVPDGTADVTISIGPFAACTETGAVCTAAAEVLSNAATATIEGPPGLSVADAQAYEADEATVDFAVTLGRATKHAVTVDYATSDGTAEAGSDYEATSGTLTFAPDETERTVSVPVLNDAHDEGEETFTLTLSNPQGGNARLQDATATGTIENSDTMPKAWLARFGRTVAEQVIEAVEGRFQASRRPGATVSLAGESIAFAPDIPGSGPGVRDRSGSPNRSPGQAWRVRMRERSRRRSRRRARGSRR